MKNKKIVLIAAAILLVLLIGFIALIVINSLIKENIPENSFIIVQGDKTITVSMEELINIGEENFSNRLRNSRGTDEVKNYTGVELINVLNHYDISLEGVENLTLSASDGYNRVYSAEDVTAENNVFIATKCEGELFVTGAVGGGVNDGGPYLIIRRSDEYSNNRVKCFVKVVID